MLPVTVYCCNKNGEKYLRRVLAGVAFCDQKIFVDDGSTDNSVKIAEEFGCEIFHWTGPNHMSERRNYAVNWEGNNQITPFWTTDPELSKNHPVIKHEWIVQVDSDEVFADDFRESLENFLKHGDHTFNAISVQLRNVYVEGGKKDQTMTTTPLPRIFKRGKVHWEQSIQNEVCYNGRTGWMPVELKHYGYGSARGHWEKQWARLKLNEDRVKASPKDLVSRGYLINCLAVLGGNPINFERLLAHISASIELFKKHHKNDMSSQVVMERTLRHLWAVCAGTGAYRVFQIVLAMVREHVDWIMDVPYWQYLCEANTEDLDPFALDQYGRKYISAMETHRKPPIRNIEVQSLGEEITVCKTIYEELLRALSLSRDLSVKKEDRIKIRNDIAKRAEWWRKRWNREVMYKRVRESGIEPLSKKINRDKMQSYANDFVVGGDVAKTRVLQEIAKSG